MTISPYEPDPRWVEAVQGLSEQARREVQRARHAQPELAKSARAFFAPALRAVGTILLIAVLVVGEIQRQQRPRE